MIWFFLAWMVISVSCIFYYWGTEVYLCKTKANHLFKVDKDIIQMPLLCLIPIFGIIICIDQTLKILEPQLQKICDYINEE